ncbi:MAG: SEC-C domain-containing protein [Candidatus Gastranaerophilales bacterium]|nr:SEC-C domain-containing protein [Candidatus Gastranaerophilales bacterium]
MKNIERSKGENITEQVLSQLCDNTFLKLWVYPNLYTDRKGGKELCDVLVFFENQVFIFSVKDIKFNKDKEEQVAWKRWKKKAIDESITQVIGAERWIREFPDRIFLDANCKNPFPFDLKKENLIVHKIIVAHGAEVACKKQSDNNIAGSLAIRYSDKNYLLDIPFCLSLNKKNIIHVLDSYNLEIILKELDTITDLSSYFEIKEKAIESLNSLTYCGEEDLLANYLMDIDEDTNKHLIIPKGEVYTDLFIEEGTWVNFYKSSAYLRKKEADKISYFWDNLIQNTAQNILDGIILGNTDVFNGNSATLEMAKEPRFMRRALANMIKDSILAFPDSDMPVVRLLKSMPSFFPDRRYIFLQFKYPKKNSDKEYIPIRRQMLELACANEKNQFPILKKVIGIAIDAPKYSHENSEDFLLLNCEKWTEEQINHYNEINNHISNLAAKIHKNWGVGTVQEFPDVHNKRKVKIGRNEKCLCGSGKKYKKCCMSITSYRQ